MGPTFFLIPLSQLFIVLFISRASGYEPEFTEGLSNLTVAVGRDATFSCVVEHLGGYRVGWVKADTKAIQAIHEHVITHNPRVSVSHSGHTTWNLHIKSVEESDRGTYMCQINTDPMKSVMGFLDVVVPPDILDDESSSDVSVSEGGSVTLVCKARGYPTPDIVWKREDRQEITLKDIHGVRKTLVHEGNTLRLNKVTRADMAHYMCMAQNGVPPAVSKRISLTVNFPPVIVVPNQLVGAPLSTDVTLACHVEASPKAIMYWMRDGSALLGDNMVVSSEKYETKVSVRSPFEKRMHLTVRNFEKTDVGTYRCVAKNSLGEVERNIRLYEIPGLTRRPTYPERTDDEDEETGSAEAESEPPPGRRQHERQHSAPAAAVPTPGGSRRTPASSAASSRSILIVVTTILPLVFVA